MKDIEKKLRVIPVGGLEEIGINMTIYEYGEDIIIVDAGLGFPGPNMPSVNFVLPNYTWLAENKHRIRGIIVTHAHLDHIGALPYVLPHIGFPPIYSMPLTVGYIKQRLREFALEGSATFCPVGSDDVLRLGDFIVSFYRVNHNIPDSVGVCITTPVGRVVHTGDWKFDWTPVDEKPAEVDKLAAFGGLGVLALLSDSTNATKLGYTPSEKTLALSIEKIFQQSVGRIIFTCNSLLLSRMQQVFDSAKKHQRKVIVMGRAISQNIETAISLGYLHISPVDLLSHKQKHRLPDHRVVILTTGGQGEEMAGLPRMSRREHRDVQLKSGDTAVVSATAIPGNERASKEMISNLQRQGVDVFHHGLMDIHTSGHASCEEHKLMIGLVKPRYLIPIHGERHMLDAHCKIGQDLGMPKENTLMPYNGDAVVFDQGGSMYIEKNAVNAERMYVDDVGADVIDAQILKDQRQMHQDGMVTIIVTMNSATKRLSGDLNVMSRGFVCINGDTDIIREIKYEVRKIFDFNGKSKENGVSSIRNAIRDQVGEYLFHKTNRRPMVLPVIIEV